MAEGKSNVTESPADRLLKLTRVFNAPRRLVYEAWTRKEHLDQWFCPSGFTIRESSADVRVGGQWHSLMIAPDGEHYPEHGIYQKIVPEELLVMTHTWVGDDGKPEHETIVTVSFEDAGAGKTRLTFEQSIFKSVESRDSHHGGWTECLDKLDAYIEKADTSDREIVISRVFDAPRELVWEAMVNPEHVVKWWGPNGFTMTIEKMEVRPGGTWKHVMHGPDGTDYPNQSVFTEVVKPERIVFVHGGGRKGGPGVQFVATWTFAVVVEGKTELKIHQVFDTPEQRDTVVREYGAIEGGRQCLARLAEFLAGKQR